MPSTRLQNAKQHVEYDHYFAAPLERLRTVKTDACGAQQRSPCKDLEEPSERTVELLSQVP